MRSSGGQRPVPADIYDRDYFLTELEGWSEFVQTGGALLPERLSYCFALAKIEPGMRILDAGFGRGELLVQCCRAGAYSFGIDYSPSAVDVAMETAENAKGYNWSLINILNADIKCLPFRDACFDRVFALDVVEHLHPWELDAALREIHRTLSPGGQLIIHSMPNRWYYAVGYPLYRVFQMFRGKRLPRDPHRRYKYMPSVHVNEQSPISLRRVLERNGFSARVWLRPVRTSAVDVDESESRIKHFLSTAYPLKFLFCSSIFAIAWHREAR